jgi:hypothetical protein
VSRLALIRCQIYDNAGSSVVVEGPVNLTFEGNTTDDAVRFLPALTVAWSPLSSRDGPNQANSTGAAAKEE